MDVLDLQYPSYQDVSFCSLTLNALMLFQRMILFDPFLLLQSFRTDNILLYMWSLFNCVIISFLSVICLI